MFDSLNEKIIFLDSDTVCQTNIKRLFDIDLEGNIFGAAQHNSLKTHKIAFDLYKPTSKLSSYVILDEFPFFNAGVMLVDCAKWREENTTSEVLNLFELYRGEHYDWNDEVAFNLLLGRTRTKFIDERWNYNKGDLIRPFIMHYYGHHKNLNNRFSIT